MSSHETKAVFLSYASQDAEAAKKICDALRAAGIEVWFDQSELVGGDAWDAKIRKQIAECALFVPVISANTQARLEGYFRIEWKLAAQRTHAMADEKAFLLPVVIDATRDAEAKVPAEFKAVQWTRLPGGEAAEKFCARVRTLLGGSELEPGNPRPGERGEGAASPASVPTKPRRSVPAPAWIVAVAAVLAVAGYFAFRTGPSARDAVKPPATTTKAPASPRTEAQQLIAKAWEQLNRTELYRSELEIADDLCKRAAALDANDPEVWATWAQVDSWLVYHNIDSSPERREAARTKAARAVRLDPRSYEARLAEACYLVRGTVANGMASSSDFIATAEQSLRALVRERDRDPRPLFALGILLRNAGRYAEGVATFDQMASLPESAATALSEKGWLLLIAGDYRDALDAADRSIAAQPFRGNLLLRLMLALMWTGDLEHAKETVAQIPPFALLEDVVIADAIEVFAQRREPEGMLRLLAAVPRPWFSTNGYTGPRHFLIGKAHRLAGSQEAAQLAWQEALRQVEQRLEQESDSPMLLWWKARLLVALGRRVEAESVARLAESVARSVDLEALIELGKTDRALTILEQQNSGGSSRPLTWAQLKFDLRYDPLRSEPRFQAMLARAEADPKRNPHAKAVDDKSAAAEKSVAVLAFDNRSDDKEAEYFSDGISEELINTLGRVPGLTVRGRTSAFFFKGKNATAREIGEKLGVAYLVRGSVRKADGKVRISAQLSRAATDEVVWTSEPITKELKDVFAVQDEIVGLIAKNLSVSMGVAARAPHSVNPEALTALLEGRHFWVLRTTEGFARARELFNRAVALDPQWAPARAALANLLTIEASFLKGGGAAVGELFAAAAREAKLAIELDATLGEPHAALGKIAMEDGRYAEAGESFRRALALEPNNAMVHDWHADLMVTQGRLDVAIPGYRRALELDPLAPYIHWDLAWELLHVRRYAEALALVERAAALTPTGSPRLTIRRARLLLELGRRAEAEAILRPYLTAEKSESDPQFANEAVWCLRALGSHADSERWAADLLRQYPESFSSGVIWLMRGDTEKAFRLLEKTPTIFQQQLYWDPVFDPVRDTPRFRQLLEKIGCAAEYKVARETLARLLEQSADLK